MLQVKGLTTKRSENRVGPIEFEVARGEVFAILGASGSGKTTLLRMIVRFEPADGYVLLDGEDVWSLPPPQLRRKVALVPQEPVVFGGTVYDNLAYGLRLAGEELPRQRATQLLALCSLEEELLDTPAKKLSTGQKMRLCIARALVNEPSVLMLDEPTAALDPAVGSRVLQAVFRHAGEKGIVVLLVTHRPKDAAAFANRAIIIHEGHQIAQGRIPDILNTPEAGFLKHQSS